MKNIRFLTFVLAIATVVLSACGAAAATPTAAPQAAQNTNAAAMPVAFVGIVDSITGDQWVISGTTVTIDDSIVRNGPFSVGDQVKVEGFVNPDGSFTVSKLETPSPKETATSAPLDDNSNDALINGNTNDASTNVNDDNGNGANINDDNSNSANVNDDNSNSSNSNDDSSSANVNDDNSNSTNSNDDNGSSANTNDDKGGSNSNDDHGGNSSNDNSSGGGGGGNDNSSGGGNSNDD